jgi:hypothetical protein
MGREHLTYHLVAKISSFLVRDSKRMLQIFYMKSRKNTLHIRNDKTNITKYFEMRTKVRIIF